MSYISLAMQAEDWGLIIAARLPLTDLIRCAEMMLVVAMIRTSDAPVLPNPVTS